MEINILVAQHKKSYVVNSNILKPITCGSYKELNKLSDSSGDNISNLNDKYCELTAQYWAWKNLKSDYFGFFHYRRFLSFDTEKKLKEYNYTCMDDFFLSDSKLSDENIRKIVEQYDIIVPSPVSVKFYGNIYKQYKFSPNHSIKDLDNIFDIVLKKYPHFKQSIEKIKKSKIFFPYNIYIMKKDIFFEYCKWLFPILEEFNKNYDYQFKNVYATRVIGFLAERLFNVYFHYIKKENKNLKVKVLPLSVIENTNNPYPKPKKNNSIPVVLACDDAYAKYAGLVIEEIAINNKKNKFYEIFVMSNNVSEIWCRRLKFLEKSNKNMSIEIVEGNRFIQNRKLRELYWVNKTTYFRLGILDYLRNYKKVIYLDCDIVVNDDLENLFNIDLENKALGAVSDIVFLSLCMNNKSIELANSKKIGIKNIWEYFNAGVLLMDIKKMNKISSCAELLNLCEKQRFLWQDQDALNVVFQGKVKLINSKWNCFSQDKIFAINAPMQIYKNYESAFKNPSIIHYAGKNLPTLNSYTWLDMHFWNYARKSVFYEEILKDICSKKSKKNPKENKGIKNKIIKIFKNYPNILILLGSIYNFFRK